MKTKTHLAFRIDIWDDTDDNIVEHVADVDDFEVAEATYRAAVARWGQVMESLRTRRNIRYITWMMDDHLVRYVSGRWAYAPEYRKMFKNWQLDGLVRFASALEPGKQRLDVYSPDSNLPVGLCLPSVKAKGFLPRDAVPETMRKYAAVWLPPEFRLRASPSCRTEHRHQDERMSGERNITIVFGPQYAAMVRFLQSTGATFVMTEDSLVDWPIISARLKNPEFRRQMLDAARTLLETELSTRIVRARWRSALCRLLDGRDDFLGQAQSHQHGPAGLGERPFAQRSLEHQQDENSEEHTSRIPDGRNGGPSQAVQ